MRLIKKNVWVLFLLVVLFALPPLGISKSWKQICNNEFQLKKLQEFAQNIRTIEAENSVPASEVESLLGEPVTKHDNTVKGEEEVWLYPHPCYGNVRFLVFFKDGKLKKINSVINVNGSDVFYRAERFLPQKSQE